MTESSPDRLLRRVRWPTDNTVGALPPGALTDIPPWAPPMTDETNSNYKESSHFNMKVT